MEQEKNVSIEHATHVKMPNGTVEKIVEKWGVDKEGHVEPPSRGGFGVITESGQRVSMWQARAYYKR